MEVGPLLPDYPDFIANRRGQQIFRLHPLHNILSELHFGNKRKQLVKTELINCLAYRDWRSFVTRVSGNQIWAGDPSTLILH